MKIKKTITLCVFIYIMAIPACFGTTLFQDVPDLGITPQSSPSPSNIAYDIPFSLSAINFGQNGSTSYASTMEENASCSISDVPITSNAYTFPSSSWTWTNSSYQVSNITSNENTWEITPAEGTVKYMPIRNYFPTQNNDYRDQELGQQICFPYNVNLTSISLMLNTPTSNTLIHYIRNISMEIRMEDSSKMDDYITDQPHKSTKIYSDLLNNSKSNNVYLENINFATIPHNNMSIYFDLNVNLLANINYWIVINASYLSTSTYYARMSFHYYSNPSLNLIASNRSISLVGNIGNATVVSKLNNDPFPVILGDTFEAVYNYHPYLSLNYTVDQELSPSEISMNATVNTIDKPINDEAEYLGSVSFDHLSGISAITFETNLSVYFNLSITLWGKRTSTPTALLEYSINQTTTRWDIMIPCQSWSYGGYTSHLRNISVAMNDPDLEILEFLSPLTDLDNNSHQIYCIGNSSNILQEMQYEHRIERAVEGNLHINLTHDGSFGEDIFFGASSWSVWIALWTADGNYIYGCGLGKFNDFDFVNTFTIGYIDQDLIPVGQYFISISPINRTAFPNGNTTRAFGLFPLEIYDYAESSALLADKESRALPDTVVNFTNARLNHSILITSDKNGILNLSALFVDEYTASWGQKNAQNQTVTVQSAVTIPYTGSKVINNETMHYFTVSVTIAVRDREDRPYPARVTVGDPANISAEIGDSGEISVMLLEGSYPIQITYDEEVVYNGRINASYGSTNYFLCPTDIDAFPTEITERTPFWIWFAIVAIVSLSIGMYVWYARYRPKRDLLLREQQDIQMKKVQYVEDVLNLSAVIIIHKYSKQAIYNQKFLLTLNEDLVSGFLGAIDEWEGEIEKDQAKRGGLQQLQYHSFTIQFIQGTSLVFVAFMRKPIQSTQMLGVLETIVKKIEKVHEHDLLEFKGYIVPYQSTIPTILSQSIDLRLQKNYHIDQNSNKISTASKQVQLWFKQNKSKGSSVSFSIPTLANYFMSQKISQNKVSAYTDVMHLVETQVIKEAYDFI